MPIDSARQIATTDFEATRHVPDYWARADRESFLFWALLAARRLLHRRRVPMPQPAELERIVLLAYQSAGMLEHAAPAVGFGFIEHVNRFIVQAARAHRRRRTLAGGR